MYKEAMQGECCSLYYVIIYLSCLLVTGSDVVVCHAAPKRGRNDQCADEYNNDKNNTHTENELDKKNGKLSRNNNEIGNSKDKNGNFRVSVCVQCTITRGVYEK